MFIGFSEVANYYSNLTKGLDSLGINYYLEDRFHIELGYHTSYVDGYEHSRIVYSIIKHFEFKDDAK